LVRAVVGWVDLQSDRAIATLVRLAHDPLFKSVRPMLQDLDDCEWILRPEVQPALAVLPHLDLRFDALVKPPHLPALMHVLDRHPRLAVVIDHGAKPQIATRQWEPWAREIATIAQHHGVYCKLSGLITEAEGRWTTDSLEPYVDHLLDCFGADRLMWGSDWPVVNLAGSYERWLDATDTLLARLSEVDREKILGGNARRFYGFA
jgi:L-fuconolactonase